MIPLFILAGSIVFLLVVIARLKLNALLALLLASLAVGLLNGLAPDAVLKSVLKGIGDTMGSLALILAFGAMLGKIIEQSGAAHRITYWLTDLFGAHRIQLSIVITGFLVGLPMIYNASFLTLIPLIYTFSVVTRQPLMMLGIPLSSALSVTHGYLPPHPAPTAIAGMFGADINITLLYGLVLTPIAIYLAGPVLARAFRHVQVEPPARFFTAREFPRDQLPGVAVSLFTLIIPVLLMLIGAIVTMAWAPQGMAGRLVAFASDPNIALGAAVLFGIVALGRRHGRSMDAVMEDLGAAVASVSMVLFIIAGGGAFKQVLLETGTGDAIKMLASRLDWSPLLLAWGTAALLRLALGSATVAAITAAGVVLPLAQQSGVRPELMVLATASGSLMFSHFNDIGFWMFKEYYNVSIKQTFQIWTVMESIVAVVGLAGVLVFDAVLPPRTPAEARTSAAVAAKPRIVTCDDFMMPNAVLGVTKVAREQGEWAAETALAILRGTKPAAIPIARNRQSRADLNRDLARRIVSQPDVELGAQCAAMRQTSTQQPGFPACAMILSHEHQTATDKPGLPSSSKDGAGVAPTTVIS